MSEEQDQKQDPAQSPEQEQDKFLTRSPDELFLELVDTLNLAFPTPVNTATIEFKATDEGDEAAMCGLDATGADGAPRRPDLGHADDEVLAILNAVVGELSNSIHERSKNRILEGRIEVRNDLEDGETEVWVIEKNPEGKSENDDLLQVKRRFDKSELVWLVHTKELFHRLNSTEKAEKEREEALHQLLQTTYSRFGANLLENKFSFFKGETDDEGDEVDVQLIGSYSPTHEAMLWGWADEAAPEGLCQDIVEFRRTVLDAGLRSLYQAELLCPHQMAERLFRHAAVSMGMPAIYPAVMVADEMEQFVYFGLKTLPTPKVVLDEK
ncbi:MAG: hypothetical protein GY822_02235 [Deltaproteobacteria bacterium]|nr:hypothetical protein [Deltaproteobacteria bacterium]